MRLSAPIYRLKRLARQLARERAIPLHQALDVMAAREGFSGWSLLAKQYAALSPAARLLARLSDGELLLLAARPGHGKTLLALELALEAMKAGRRAAVFTLESTEIEILDRLARLGATPAELAGSLEIDTAADICARYVVDRLAGAASGTLVVVDYLQLLDQKRANPPLGEQVETLRRFARERGLMLVFLSQIDRSFDPARRPCPDIRDVRLPNPVDLGLFDKRCFLHDGEIRLETAA